MFFSGSYSPDDVQFLLKPIGVPNTPVPLKETLIQSGARHYSEMLTHEQPPSGAYLELFHTAMSQNVELLAEHVLILAGKIVAAKPATLTLVSLARAGTPIGVLLKRVIERYWQKQAPHYSISIVRDIGIDTNALHYMLQKHAPESLVFVDGWTGKGVIARQLEKSLHDFAGRYGITIAPELYVLTDLAGSAAVAASSEDYLIPSSILNATVSGLISRSVLDQTQLSPSDFHGCLYYAGYAPHDLSRYFIEAVISKIDGLLRHRPQQAFTAPALDKARLQAVSRDFLHWTGERYGIWDCNHIKPGIGEATRVLLRRSAYRLLLRDAVAVSVQHLLWLAQNKGVAVECVSGLPYRAAALIKKVN